MANYKEALFFIGKCLTAHKDAQNKTIVEKQLKNNNIDWDYLVRVSTSHYVFPALYCNLKSAGLLHYLPKDLVEYMKHITGLNRERNLQIIEEANKINAHLRKHNIAPIFLKGTGNLLEGLYDDIAERMVGDIDILVKKEECDRAFTLLLELGYTNKISEVYDEYRHLPRITSDNKLAAVEIHWDIIGKKSRCFNYNTIQSTLIEKRGFLFLSIEDQIKLTIYAKFVNDEAYHLKNTSLRAAYDVFLLHNNLTNQFEEERDLLSAELKTGLTVYSIVLGTSLSIPESVNLARYDDFFSPITRKKKYLKAYLLGIHRLRIMKKAMYKKSYFKYVVSKIFSIKWWRLKLGFSKDTSYTLPHPDDESFGSAGVY